MDQPCVPCKTLEEDIIQVPLDVMRQSKTFDGIYRNLGLANNTSFVFPVAIKTEIFKKVVDWCKNHIGTKELIVKEHYASKERTWWQLTDYQKHFLGVPVDELVQLIAANYLDVKSLIQLGCQSLAQLMRNKTPEEVRDLLGIVNDLTEEEVQEIKKQNIWCNY